MSSGLLYIKMLIQSRDIAISHATMWTIAPNPGTTSPETLLIRSHATQSLTFFILTTSQMREIQPGNYVTIDRERFGHNGSAHNGSAHNGSAHNGSAHNGSAHNGSAHNGSARDVPWRDVPWRDVPWRDVPWRDVPLETLGFLIFQLLSQKNWFLFYFTSILHSSYKRFQIWPTLLVPSAANHSMHPIANPFYALSALVQSMPAELATKHSFVVTTYPFQSACSVTPPSHIPTFSNSDSQRPSSPDLSHDTRKTFYSLKNLPCFPPHKPPSPMTDSSTTLISNYATYTHKSTISTLSSTIFSLPKIFYNDKLTNSIYYLFFCMPIIHHRDQPNDHTNTPAEAAAAPTIQTVCVWPRMLGEK